ncbi:MAG: hypothetical protein HC781_21585 [Leptolyngbyaceae cyanobacterium CSU_1_4]|nr:hypothetical protein [Leptolyngbyaceae cyanobacterium CSU_1_4]
MMKIILAALLLLAMMPFSANAQTPQTADDYIQAAFDLADAGKYDDAMINYQRAIDASAVGSCDRGHAEAGLTAAKAAKEGETFLDVLTRESGKLPGECLI